MTRRHNRGTHHAGIKSLEGRLRGSGYDYIKTELVYHKNRYQCEFDILTRRDVYHHYYEYKSHDSPQARSKAAEQFWRAQKAYPDRHWKFVYVTPQRVLRYHPDRGLL